MRCDAVVVETLDPLLLGTEVIRNDLHVALDLNVQTDVKIYDLDLYISTFSTLVLLVGNYTKTLHYQDCLEITLFSKVLFINTRTSRSGGVATRVISKTLGTTFSRSVIPKS